MHTCRLSISPQIYMFCCKCEPQPFCMLKLFQRENVPKLNVLWRVDLMQIRATNERRSFEVLDMIMMVTPRLNYYGNGKALILIGNTSSKGPCSIATLVYRSVLVTISGSWIWWTWWIGMDMMNYWWIWFKFSKWFLPLTRTSCRKKSSLFVGMAVFPGFLQDLQVHVWTLHPLSSLAEDQSEMKDVCIKLQKFLGG